MKTLFLLVFIGAMVGCNLQVEEPKAPNRGIKTSSVEIDMGEYTTAMKSFQRLFMQDAYAAVSNITFCFKRLRFKYQNDDELESLGLEDNVDLSIGEVSIDSNGVTLGTIEVPQGTYRRIEFDLESDCGLGKSIDLTNDHGSFSTTDRVTIKFEGTFVADNASEKLTLSVQSILDAANSYNGTGDLAGHLESASGSF